MEHVQKPAVENMHPVSDVQSLPTSLEDSVGSIMFQI